MKGALLVASDRAAQAAISSLRAPPPPPNQTPSLRFAYVRRKRFGRGGAKPGTAWPGDAGREG